MKNKPHAYTAPPRIKAAKKKPLTMKDYREAYRRAELLVAAAKGDT